jgi:hypothetical protein
LARESKQEKKEAKAAKRSLKSEPKDVKKARKDWQDLEGAIDHEFATLVRDGFDQAELETLRWDYRYDKLPEYEGITQEQLEFFVAESEARAAGIEAPHAPWDTGAPSAAKAGEGAAAPSGTDYQRKSQVDMDIIEKYLDKRVAKDTRSELEAVYKEAFGEDLLVPKNLDLVDLSYMPSDVSDADRQRKLSKAEILGLPEDIKAEAAKKEDEAKVEAASAVKKESSALAFATAFRKGVPEGPGFGSKWAAYNPFHLWVIPKKYCGSSVPRYYLFFLINLVLTVLLFIPRIIIWPIVFIFKVLNRFVAPKAGGKLGAKIKGFQDKLAETTPKADPDKGKAPAKST